MFEDYSIAGASQPHGYYAVMDDDISPTSSRTTTPTPEEANIYQPSSSMDSVAELSYRLEQHTLGAREQRPNVFEYSSPLSPPSLEIEPPTTSSSLRTRRRRSSSLLIWQQRQAMTRRQCTTPAHLAHISALVEDVSPDVNNPYYDASHPSSTYHQSPVSPTSNPTSFACFDSTPSSSGSEDCGSETSSCSSGRVLASKIGKEWRRGGSSEAMERKQKWVLKKIKMRRSLLRMRAGE